MAGLPGRLGCNGLALGPVFASGTQATTPSTTCASIASGDDAAFDRMVESCRARGVRLLLDGVFTMSGGTSRGSERRGRGPDSPRQWFRWQDGIPSVRGPRPARLARPRPPRYASTSRRCWPLVDRGADGWRLDAAYQIPRSFWAAVLPGVRERHPDAWFVGEVIHGDYREFVAESGLNSVTQYELWKSIWSALNDANLHELAWNLGRHDELLASFTPLTFVGNHDVTRIASKLTNPTHLGHAVAVLMTVGGVPSVYAGDEQAFTGGRRNASTATTPFATLPGHPRPLAPSAAHPVHQRLIGLRRRHRGSCTRARPSSTSPTPRSRCAPSPATAARPRPHPLG